jgi:hypothetical protein
MHRGKEVTFKDVLILFLKKFERILIVAVCFAVVFAALGAWRTNRSFRGDNQQKLMDQYLLSLEEYNQTAQTLQKVIEQDKEHLENLELYTQDSLYYNMDAYNMAVSELVFYVDTGYQIVPGQYYQTPNKTGEIVSAYCDAYRSAELYDGIRAILGSEIDMKYLDELLTIERAGDIKIKDSVGNVTVRHSDGNEGVILIRAKAPDEQTAGKITQYTFDYLREKFGNAIAAHTATVISDSAMTIVDDSLEELHKQVKEEIDELEESIKTKEAELATLERDMPQEPTVSMKSVVKKAILFGILGGVLGGVFICLWVLLAYLADNRLDGAYQAQRLYALELFGVVQANRRRPIFAKLIDNMEDNTSRQNFESAGEAVDYTCASLKAVSNNQNGPQSVAVVSTQEDEQVLQLMQLMEQHSDRELSYLSCPAVLKNAQSLQRALQADSVVLLEHSGVSYLSEIDRQILRLERADKEILGMLLTE